MVHRHSLTFRHSQGEARITSHETRNEQANGLLAWVQGGFSPPWESTPRGRAAMMDLQLHWGQPRCPTRQAPGLQGPLSSPIQDAILELPRVQALARNSTQNGEGSGLPFRLQEAGPGCGGRGGSRPGDSQLTLAGGRLSFRISQELNGRERVKPSVGTGP